MPEHQADEHQPGEPADTPDLDLDVSHVGDTAVVRVTGELDGATAPQLEECLNDICNNTDTRNLVLDFAGMTFMDSSGIRLLLGAEKRLHERAGTVSIRHPRDIVRRLLQVMGLEAILLIEPER